MAIKESSFGQRQLDLLDYLRALEQAVSPTSNCGLSEIRECLYAVEVSLRHSLQDDPFNNTNGLDPRLEHAEAQLAEEEARLHGSLQELIAKTQCQSLATVDEAFCEAVRDWIRSFRRHSDRTTDLIQDAWDQDIGNGD